MCPVESHFYLVNYINHFEYYCFFYFLEKEHMSPSSHCLLNVLWTLSNDAFVLARSRKEGKDGIFSVRNVLVMFFLFSFIMQTKPPSIRWSYRRDLLHQWWGWKESSGKVAAHFILCVLFLSTTHQRTFTRSKGTKLTLSSPTHHWWWLNPATRPTFRIQTCC